MATQLLEVRRRSPISTLFLILLSGSFGAAIARPESALRLFYQVYEYLNADSGSDNDRPTGSSPPGRPPLGPHVLRVEAVNLRTGQFETVDRARADSYGLYEFYNVPCDCQLRVISENLNTVRYARELQTLPRSQQYSLVGPLPCGVVVEIGPLRFYSQSISPATEFENPLSTK
jgi:hypothetical protein